MALRGLVPVALTAAIAILLWSFGTVPNRIGADWFWYRDGIDRLAAGLPLYRPEWLTGPFDYLAPGNVNGYNQAPWLLPIVAPFALLGEPLSRHAWWLLTFLAVSAALLPVAPRRWWAPLLILWSPVWMTLLWGNTEALVALGVALWIVGRRRGSVVLEAMGIVLASLKVMPAVPMVLLSARDRRWAPVVLAAFVVAAVTTIVGVISGSNVLTEFVVLARNFEPVLDHTNISPAAQLGGSPTAYLVQRTAALIACVVIAWRVRSTLLALVAMEAVCCLIGTNTYVDWLLPVLLAGLAYMQPEHRAHDSRVISNGPRNGRLFFRAGRSASPRR